MVIRHNVKDVNRDGLGDLLLRFNILDTGIACGDDAATLTGQTYEGQPFAGTDTIETVGCKARPGKNKAQHKPSRDPDRHRQKAYAKHHDEQHHGKKADKEKTDKDWQNEKGK